VPSLILGQTAEIDALREMKHLLLTIVAVLLVGCGEKPLSLADVYIGRCL